jgi:beta-glucosidase
MYFKTLLLSALITATTLPAHAQSVPQLHNDNIESVIATMTLEEKATLVVGDGMDGFSMQPVIGSSSSIVPGAAGTTKDIPHLGIPPIVLSDGPAGLRINVDRLFDHNKYYATHFPIGTSLASTWNTALVENVARAMGQEVREYGVDVLLGPALCLQRNPLCGRNFEYYSEDPVLSGNIAAAYVNGIQSQGVGTSVKHFAFNNQETQRMGNDVRVSQRAARELYLKNFQICIQKSNPWTVMSSYNLINGTMASENQDLLTTILRDEWGYKGLVMTDWFGGVDPVRRCGKADRSANMKAGNDLIEPGMPKDVDEIVNAVKSGKLDEKYLDQCVRNVLKLALKSQHYKGYTCSNHPDLEAHAKVTREAAAEGTVLLKNDGTLPLQNIHNIALYGNASYSLIAGGTGSGNVNRAYTISLVEGLRNAGYSVDTNLTNQYVTFLAKWMYTHPKKSTNVLDVPELPVEADITITDEEVKNNDVAIVTLCRISGEGQDRTAENYNLTKKENELVQKVCNAYHKTGKKVIVVLNVGGVMETASWKSMPDAILLPWQGGQEIGNSIADVLSGKTTPSGKLPMTWPISIYDDPTTKNFPIETAKGKTNSTNPQNVLVEAATKANLKNVGYTNYEEGIYVGYRYYDTFQKEVSYPFGFGLSYTTFTYGKPVIKDNGKKIDISVSITNTGKFPGKEVAEVYASAPKGGEDKPMQELKAFAKTRTLQPGEKETLSMSINKSDLASFYEKKSSWIVDPGVYTFRIGSSSKDIKVEGKLTLKKMTQRVHNVLKPQVKLNVLKPGK